MIEAHFPLHKGQVIASIHSSFKHYYTRLLSGYLRGNWVKYFQPISIIKNYFGEKPAFQYCYLIHYQAFLLVPSIAGVCLTVYTAKRYYDTRELKQSIDTTANGIFGLLTAIWATFFFESWKRKQRTIQYLWNCKDGSFSQTD